MYVVQRYVILNGIESLLLTYFTQFGLCLGGKRRGSNGLGFR